MLTTVLWASLCRPGNPQVAVLATPGHADCLLRLHKFECSFRVRHADAGYHLTNHLMHSFVPFLPEPNLTHVWHNPPYSTQGASRPRPTGAPRVLALLLAVVRGSIVSSLCGEQHTQHPDGQVNHTAFVTELHTTSILREGGSKCVTSAGHRAEQLRDSSMSWGGLPGSCNTEWLAPTQLLLWSGELELGISRPPGRAVLGQSSLPSHFPHCWSSAAPGTPSMS